MNRCVFNRYEKMCILCQCCHEYVNLIYDKILDNKIIIMKIKEFDLEFLLPFLRNTFVEWFIPNKTKIINMSDLIKNVKITNNVFIKYLKKIIYFYENQNKKYDKKNNDNIKDIEKCKNNNLLNHVKKHNGFLALEFLKTYSFKFIYESL